MSPTPLHQRLPLSRWFFILLSLIGLLGWFLTKPRPATPAAPTAQRQPVATSRHFQAPSTGLPSDRGQLLKTLQDAFYALADPQADRGNPPYADFCSALTPGTLDLYLDLLASIGNDNFATERANLRLALLHRWATFDRPAALQFATGLPSRPRAQALSQLVRSWARSDRDGAWAYVQNTLLLHESDPGLNLFGPFLADVAHEDPEWALARLRQLPPGAIADTATRSFFTSQAMIDVDRAMTWIDSLPSTSMREQAFYTLTLHNGPANPRQAIETFAQLSLPPSEMAQSTSRLTRIWADQNAEAAINWTDQSTQNPLFPTVAATLAEQLTHADINTARQWLSPHRDDPQYLPALKTHLAIVASGNSAEARAWAQAATTTRTALLNELQRLGY